MYSKTDYSLILLSVIFMSLFFIDLYFIYEGLVFDIDLTDDLILTPELEKLLKQLETEFKD